MELEKTQKRMLELEKAEKTMKALKQLIREVEELEEAYNKAMERVNKLYQTLEETLIPT
jgi:hypothetical protein